MDRTLRLGDDDGATELAVAVAALVAWLFAAVVGLRLAFQGGAIRLLLPTRWRPTRRQAWSHRTLFVGHVGLAVAGLGLWIWYVLTARPLAGWLALGLIVLVASYGLSLVERWIPGRGKHATGRSADPARKGYFPVFAATAHVMTATLALGLVAMALINRLTG